MKIYEIITEDRNWTKTSGKLHPQQIETMPSAHIVSGTADRVYDLYRLGMIAALADGKTPLKPNAESWIGRNNAIHPFTKAEADMIKSAYIANGIVWTDELHPNPDNRSFEPKDTFKTSPVPKRDWKKKTLRR